MSCPPSFVLSHSISVCHTWSNLMFFNGSRLKNLLKNFTCLPPGATEHVLDLFWQTQMSTCWDNVLLFLGKWFIFVLIYNDLITIILLFLWWSCLYFQIFRFKVHVQVIDNSGSTTFILFDWVVAQFLGRNVQDLLDSNLGLKFVFL
jgi:hypothetical protein